MVRIALRGILAAGFLLAGVFSTAFPPLEAAEPFGTEHVPNRSAFQAVQLSPGIFLLRPAAGVRNHTNSLVFERSDGLLVVDAQPSPDAARDLLAAIAELSSEPVRYLVFTHPHLASSGGASAFPREVLRIAGRGYRDAVADPEFDYLAEWKASMADRPGALLLLQEEIERRPRPAAVLTLMGRTRLEDPRHPIILMPIPPAHSPGDLLVFDPESRILAVGDLLFNDGNPYAGQARIPSWIDRFNQILTMEPKKIVPLRGNAVEIARVRNQRDALRWLRRTVRKALAEKKDDEEISEELLAGQEIARYFNTRAIPSNLDLLIQKVVEEVHRERRAQGLE